MGNGTVAPEYRHLLIGESNHFHIGLNEDQRYLGRAWLWLKRDGDMQRFSDLYVDELIDLQRVCRRYESALETLWQPDLINYAWLTNMIHLHGGHGHLHLIPRYIKERMFAGRIYTDDRWGKNAWPATAFKSKASELEQIRSTIARHYAR